MMNWWVDIANWLSLSLSLSISCSSTHFPHQKITLMIDGRCYCCCSAMASTCDSLEFVGLCRTVFEVSRIGNVYVAQNTHLCCGEVTWPVMFVYLPCFAISVSKLMEQSMLFPLQLQRLMFHNNNKCVARFALFINNLFSEHWMQRNNKYSTKHHRNIAKLHYTNPRTINVSTITRRKLMCCCCSHRRRRQWPIYTKWLQNQFSELWFFVHSDARCSPGAAQSPQGA